jgi:hypothetical protein
LRALENNKNANSLEKIIIANGLGRFFAAENNLEKQDAERFAGEFAAAILK